MVNNVSPVDEILITATAARVTGATVTAPSSHDQERVVNVKVLMARNGTGKFSGCKNTSAPKTIWLKWFMLDYSHHFALEVSPNR